MSKLTKRTNMVDKSKYGVKCPYEMTPKYITVHNTYNDASAWNEVKYMVSNNNEVSYHYAVDDIEVVQGIPENRNAWACGDGGKGTGNRESINVEICYSKSGGDKFIKAEKNASVFVAELLKKYNLPISKVKKHQDWSKKYCPHRTLDMGWDRFIKMVQTELDALNKPSTPATSTATTTYYRVVCGSYLDRKNADNMVAELVSKKYSPFIDVFTKDNKKYYRVVCGSFTKKDNANNLVNELKKRGYNPFIDIYKK